MKKRFILLLFIIFFISGCSFNNFEPSNLMHPPKATGEMAQIQDLIEKTVGADIFFKYPQNGDFKSAIIMHDLDGDDQDEAIAVYQTSAQDTQSYIMIIDKIEEAWQVVKTITAKNTDLDKVCFGDINGDGKDDIILGWSSYTNYGKEITVILYENANYNVITPKETYSDILVNDFDGDGKSEILTLSLSKREDSQVEEGEKAAKAKLIKFDNNSNDVVVIGSTFIDSTVVKYNHVKFGKIDSSQNGAVIDAVTDKGRTTSEIVYWDKNENKLKAPLYNSKTLSSTTFLRDSEIPSNDINNDGIIELPKVDLTDGSNEKYTYILSWFKYNTNNHRNDYVESIIMNVKDSYIFVIPNKWKNSQQGSYKIRFVYDYDLKSIRFFENLKNNDQILDEREFLNIFVISQKEYEELSNKEIYNVLAQENNKVYLSTEDFNSELAISVEEMKSCFKII